MKEVAATMENYPEARKRVGNHIPNAKLVESENCGHIPHFAAAEKSHAALLEFLGQR